MRALQYAAALAHETDATLTVLHVIELTSESSESYRAELNAYRAARFDEVRSSLTRALADLRDTCSTAQLILVGKPYREILRIAAEQQSDLIAMGAQGHGAIDVALFGSTTHHVLRQAACPVLTLKALA
jgi:nucleotide-binding universal stress UspA family protein